MNHQRRFNPALWILACVVLNALAINLVSAQSPSDDSFITITPENANQIELGYVYPDICSDYQRSGNLIVIAKDGIYDVFTGKERIDNKGVRGTFSPDERYFGIPKAQLSIRSPAINLRLDLATSVPIPNMLHQSTVFMTLPQKRSCSPHKM